MQKKGGENYSTVIKILKRGMRDVGSKQKVIIKNKKKNVREAVGSLFRQVKEHSNFHPCINLGIMNLLVSS